MSKPLNEETLVVLNNEPMSEQLIKVCDCGCNRPFEKVYESMRYTSGWLNPDQAQAQLTSKMVPASEVKP